MWALSDKTRGDATSFPQVRQAHRQGAHEAVRSDPQPPRHGGLFGHGHPGRGGVGQVPVHGPLKQRTKTAEQQPKQQRRACLSPAAGLVRKRGPA